jgi:ligand-binding sensor domain-containing protein/signal transduction histidine kinase
MISIYRLNFSIITVVLNLIFYCFGQSQEPRFLQLPLDKGVSLNLTYDMVQDSKGFLWFGTMYGLVKYDGENFITYNYNPDDTTSISFDDVISLFEDSKGNLWIGTWGGGLNMFDASRTTFTRFSHNPVNLNSIANNIIWSICEDRNGIIWIGTGSGGLQKYNPSSGDFTSVDLYLIDSTNVKPSIQALLADNNFIWIGHSKGLSKLNIQTGVIQQINLVENSNSSLSSALINAIYKDSKRNYWIGTSNGLKRYDQIKQKFIPYNFEGNNVTSIVEDDAGKLWIGSSKGLLRLNTANDEYEIFNASKDENTLAGNYINKVLVDKSGIVWAASYNAGITKIILTPTKFNTLQHVKENPKSLSNNNIKAITEDENGNIYIGTYGNRINVFNPLTGINSHIALPVQKFIVVHSLTVNNSNLWIGTSNTLLNYDLTRKRFVSIPFTKEQKNEIGGKSITALKYDSEDNLWIGTYNQGVYRFNSDEKILSHFSHSEKQNISHTDFILSIYLDSNKRVWIGTYRGVYRFESETEKFKSIVQNQNNPKGLSNNYVYSIVQDSRGYFWFGTASGLNRFDSKTKSFQHFFKKDGLPSDVIFGIVEENPGNIWLSTNKGISRYSAEDNSFLSFDKDDGLQGNVFNPSAYFKSSDGTIYFGGMNGLNFFAPTNLEFSGFNPPVVITSLKIKTNEATFTGINPVENQIELKPDQNSIKIEFAALDFTNSEKNEYQYKLFGFNEDWISLNNSNSVTFSRLPPSNYSFQLMGTNSDGIWSENFASVSFVIHPHFWQTWWFIPAVVLGLVLISFLIHLLILKSKVKSAVKIQRIKEEESEKVRKKTAIDFHDELGHRLTRISLLTEIVKRKIGLSFSDISPLLDQISENSARLYDGTKDFIWAIDPKKDSLYELIVRLKDFGDDIFSSTNVNFNVQEISEELQKASLDMDWKRHLMLIFKEGMNNSLKHSKGQKVSLTSSIKDDEFELVLEDDGVGFETDENLKGNGLKNIQKRAEILEAEVQIDSQPGVGTKLSFKGKFPIKSVHFN